MIGRTLGHYRIDSKLGEGGMGVVYKARDTHLDRPVAIKVLPAEAVANAERKRRFVLEAKTASALNHPNILHIYDIDTTEGVDFIAMEYVEGRTVEELIGARGCKLEEALKYAVQIADALAAAHAAGIVHRDIKPGNVMITEKGLVKVLDFGLAKLSEPEEGEFGSTQTMRTRTEEGTILGTIAYMSPEQAEGKKVDARSDIFSFGSLLYEMVTGRRAFQGPTKISTLSAILHKEPPPMRASVEDAPQELEKIIGRCLRKDCERRFQHMGDAKLALEELAEEPPRVTPPPPPPVRFPARLVVAAVAVAVVAVLISVEVIGSRRSQVEPAIRLSFAVDATDDIRNALVGEALLPLSPSPDGLHFAFIGSDRSGKAHLWLRSLNSLAAVRLLGTEGSSTPFWSADSRWIGFWADGKLKKISPSGGMPQTIAEPPQFTDVWPPAWNQHGDILFSPGNQSPLYRVRESGGPPQPATKLDSTRAENSHRFPQFLPDGRRFLHTARSRQRENDAIYLGSLDSPERKLILPLGSNASYVPSARGREGWLLFYRDGLLLAQPFRPYDGSLSGEPVPIAENVEYAIGSRRASFAASSNGRVLIYRTGAPSFQLTWFDRAGAALGVLGAPGQRHQPRISPDGKRVAFMREDDRTGNYDIWYLETARGIAARLTSHPASDWFPFWSPDGSRVLFGSDRDGKGNLVLYEKSSLDANASEEPVPGNVEGWFDDLSADGRWIAFRRFRQREGQDIWVQPLFVDRKPFPWLETEFNEHGPHFSPDGKWLAYVSNESGGYEVYVRAFRGTPSADDAKLQVSAGGGDFPRWSRDGKELFYISSDLTLVSVPAEGFAKHAAAAPRQLFRPCPENGMSSRPFRGASYDYPYDVSSDGRFLFNCLAGKPRPPIVVVNWQSDLIRWK